MSFAIKRNVKTTSDINHNFHVLDWLLRGNLSTENIGSISVDKITGSLRATEIIIGASTEFEAGYDYRGKLTYLSESGIYTGKIYASQIELGSMDEEDGMTIIRGGYLNTETIEASSITADKLFVNDLTAITANFTYLRSGSVSDYVELYESAGKPYVNFIDSDKLRMGLTSDRLQFFTTLGNYGGTLVAEEDPMWNLPAITVASSFMARMISVDSFVGFDRSSGVASRIHSGDLNIPPELQIYTLDFHEETEVDKLTITDGCTADGDVTLTLNEVDYIVALTTTEDTAEKVAIAIYNHLDSVVDFDLLWTMVRDGAVITFTSVDTGSRTAPVYTDTDTTGATGTAEVVTAGYIVDTAAYIALDAHGDSIASPFGNIDLVGITRIYGINAEDMNRGYKITKNGAGGIGIINFTCES
jgi:hypothetical protein